MQLPDLDEQLSPRRFAFFVKYRANMRCEECTVNYRLHAHHLDRNRNNNCLRNGKCLCAKCHKDAHQFLNYPILVKLFKAKV